MELVPQLLLVVVIVILAGPQVQRVPDEERILSNIQICMDVSSSMSVDGRYQMARKPWKSLSIRARAMRLASPCLVLSKFAGRR